MSNIPSITNTAVRCFFIFLIVYLWLGFLVSSWLVTVVLAALLTFAANLLFVSLMRRRSNLNKQTKEQNEHMQKTILQLKFMKPQQALMLFKTALEKKYTCILTARKLTVKTPTGQIELFSLFHKEVSMGDIIECYNNSNKKGAVYIAAETINPKITEFISKLRIDIKLLNGAAVYHEILAPTDTFPEFNIETKTAVRRTLSQIKTVVFSPVRTKGYLITAIIIFATSFLVKFSLYYIIIATVVFGLAIASQFGSKENTNLFQ